MEDLQIMQKYRFLRSSGDYNKKLYTMELCATRVINRLYVEYDTHVIIAQIMTNVRHVSERNLMIPRIDGLRLDIQSFLWPHF